MKVLLIGNYEADGSQSMLRFCKLLERGLGAAGVEVRTIRPRVIAGKMRSRSAEIKKWVGYIDKFVFFPKEIKTAVAWADLVHVCDHSNAMYTRDLGAKPNLITCHDVIAIRSGLGQINGRKIRWSGRQLQRMILRGLNSANHVACVSCETKKQLLSVSSLLPEQTTVVQNGLNYEYSSMSYEVTTSSLSELGLAEDLKFALCLGSNEWYKNRLGAMKAFFHFHQHNPEAKLNLVVAGKPWTDEMRSFTREKGMSRHIFELVSISDHHLNALYCHAKMLLFPSLLEGFGWPIIEAQACGCPVVTSNQAPMTEVSGGAAIFVDPTKSSSIADGMVEALRREDELRTLGLVNARKYAPKNMIDSYVAIYQNLIRPTQ